MPLAVVAGSALGLTGCFDLAQNVALHRDGSGSYSVAVSADGVVGGALGRKDSDIDIGDDLKGVTTVKRNGDVTTETKEVAFHDLSDLHLGDETLSLHVAGSEGDATKVSFRRAFRIDHARRRRDEDENHLGHQVLQSMFGGHFYTFAVWLPGRIERIAPVTLGGHSVAPVVWGDASGHTIVWKMPLSDMMMARELDFDVDFAATGSFHDSQSGPARHRHRHRDDS